MKRTMMTAEAVAKHTHHASPAHEPPAAIRAAGIVVVLTVVLAILAIAFALTYYPGEAALRDAIHNRDVYGGISLGPDGRSLLIATGGSPVVAQMLTQIGNGIAQQAHVPLRTEDLAPPTGAVRAWPRRRCRSPWPACCQRSPWCCCSSARCGRASRPPWFSPP